MRKESNPFDEGVERKLDLPRVVDSKKEVVAPSIASGPKDLLPDPTDTLRSFKARVLAEGLDWSSWLELPHSTELKETQVYAEMPTFEQLQLIWKQDDVIEEEVSDER